MYGDLCVVQESFQWVRASVSEVELQGNRQADQIDNLIRRLVEMSAAFDRHLKTFDHFIDQHFHPIQATFFSAYAHCHCFDYFGPHSDSGGSGGFGEMGWSEGSSSSDELPSLASVSNSSPEYFPESPLSTQSSYFTPFSSPALHPIIAGAENSHEVEVDSNGIGGGEWEEVGEEGVGEIGGGVEESS